jgi:hypothetical protein
MATARRAKIFANPHFWFVGLRKSCPANEAYAWFELARPPPEEDTLCRSSGSLPMGLNGKTHSIDKKLVETKGVRALRSG